MKRSNVIKRQLRSRNTQRNALFKLQRGTASYRDKLNPQITLTVAYRVRQ